MLKRAERGAGWRTVLWIAIGLVGLAAAPAWGDVLHLKNGKTYTGKLISRDAKKIIFLVEEPQGIAYKMQFNAGDVESIEETGKSGGAKQAEPDKPAGQDTAAPKPAGQNAAGGGDKTSDKSAGPRKIEKRPGRGDPYYVLPIQGVIGLEVNNKIVEECFDAAREVGAKVVVLEIESPGGAVSELKLMLNTLEKNKSIRTIAYVHEAKSAAAVLAMACHEIVMTDRAAIGAAVPYKLAPDGTPQNISEKFASSLRADFRSVAERGGHEPLLMEGMVRDDLVLSLKKTGNGGYKVVEGSGDKILKKQGEILTLTTKEAIECGLAVGSSDRLADARKLLKISDWYDVTDDGRDRVAEWTKKVEAAKEEFHKFHRNFMTGITDANMAVQAHRRQAFTDALRRAESNLRRMEELAQKFPGLGDEDTLRSLRDQLSAVRKAVER